jgi:hypothetical protein
MRIVIGILMGLALAGAFPDLLKMLNEQICPSELVGSLGTKEITIRCKQPEIDPGTHQPGEL